MAVAAMPCSLPLYASVLHLNVRAAPLLCNQQLLVAAMLYKAEGTLMFQFTTISSSRYIATSLSRQQVLCPVCKAGWLVQEGSVVLCSSSDTTSTCIGDTNTCSEATSCSFQLDTGSYDAQLEVIRRVRITLLDPLNYWYCDHTALVLTVIMLLLL
jgi:hypothetical protein